MTEQRLHNDRKRKRRATKRSQSFRHTGKARTSRWREVISLCVSNHRPLFFLAFIVCWRLSTSAISQLRFTAASMKVVGVTLAVLGEWSIFFYFLLVLINTPEGRPGMSDVPPPVWNLRAVIWFHFAISSLVFLPSAVTLSTLSFSVCWSFLLNFFQKILQYCSLRDRLLCMTPV